MSFADIWPVYLLFVPVLLAAMVTGRTVAVRVLALIALVHAGPVGMLVWGTVMFGESPAGPAQAVTWVELVQFGIGLAGLAVVVTLWRTIRQPLPKWTALAFFAGVALINLMTLFVTGMALTDDWI